MAIVTYVSQLSILTGSHVERVNGSGRTEVFRLVGHGVTHNKTMKSTYLILLTQILYITCHITNTMSTGTTEYPAGTIFKCESILPSVLYHNNTSLTKSEARRSQSQRSSMNCEESEARRSPLQCSCIFCDENRRKTNFHNRNTESVSNPMIKQVEAGIKTGRNSFRTTGSKWQVN